MKRASDGKYLSTSGAWISDGTGAKKTFNGGDTLALDLSVINKDGGNEAFAFVAVWNELPAVKYGDTDGDDDITLKDLKLILKYIASSATEDEISLEAADVDGNGIISVQDAKYIQKYLSMSISEFPVEEQ